ncbi:hypothetical protein E3T55_12295 [Cryobacterium frigoriphilum]|uniref:Uncharacterized protein n=1 Tax=Cryobacterium frigoriphilum TaxID=1259150 RepID=A0A4R8ZYF7_9MICO|nr:hypothetical protein [Cryobacterium frigoriphilum]TFD48832.1 hypothetical protein E3T55_12295 [Cryobacterium frigoriphilum]
MSAAVVSGVVSGVVTDAAASAGRPVALVFSEREMVFSRAGFGVTQVEHVAEGIVYAARPRSGTVDG